jgi:hypothetical protein
MYVPVTLDYQHRHCFYSETSSLVYLQMGLEPWHRVEIFVSDILPLQHVNQKGDD